LRIPGGTCTIGFKMVPKDGQGCNLPFLLVDNKRVFFPHIFSSLYVYLYAYFEYAIEHANAFDCITTFVLSLVLYLSCRLIPAEDQDLFDKLERRSTLDRITRCITTFS
jgi:hypothetical protein